MIALAIGWLATVAATFAQSTGTIQGRVFNPATRQYVRDAEVRLEGTNQVTYTTNDGSFQFGNVPVGQTTLMVSYTGYNTEKQTFAVDAGKTAVREVNLTTAADGAGAPTKDGVIQLQAFTVATEREGNAKAIMAQRRNMDISTSVSSDIFGEVADGNVGEFLKYLPGVDLDYVESEARGPRLGGMDAQYVGVSFDGMRTASADANRGGGESSRATSFEGFAITAIESIEISRTTSAESPADSPAGTINMKTKRAFDRKGRRFNYNFGLNFNAEEFTLKRTAGPSDGFHYKWLPNYSFDYSESFFGQKLGVLFSASHANSYTEQYEVDHSYNRTPNATLGDTRPLVLRQVNFKDGNKFIVKDSYLLTTDWRVSRHLVLSLNAQYTYTEGEFWNRNFTFIAANDNANVNNGRSTVGGNGVTNLVATRAETGLVNNVATLNNGGGSASKLTYTRSLSPRFEYKRDNWLFDGAMNYSRSVNNYESLERGFSNSEGGGVPASFTATRPSEASWEWTIRQTSGADWFPLGNFINTNIRDGGTRVNNDDRTWVTELWVAQLNATWNVPFMERFPTKLKFGGRWDEEDRENNNMSDWNIWSYIGPGGNTVTRNPTTGASQNVTFGNWANLGSDFISPHPFDMGTTNGLTIFNINGQQGMPQRASRNTIATLFRARPDQFVHMGTPENFFATHVNNKRDFRQTVESAFTQADVRVTPKLQMRFGIRMEETINAFTEFDPLTRAQVAAAGYVVNAPGTNNGRAVEFDGIRYQFFTNPRITRESSYRNYFPSVMGKYQIMPDLEFQVGFNKAISRPPIDNLTGLWNVDELNERVNAPNPELQPEYSKNFQARLARYFSGRSPGSLAIAVSQNDIRNLRETFDFSASEFGVDDPDFATYTFRSTRNSAERRRFRNLEFSYSQTLGFLPSEYLRGVNYNVAYTRSYASQRRNNLAPHRLTSRLGYNYRRFNGSLGMVWRDDSPDGIYGRFRREITQFDLSISFRVNRWATLYADGRNITGRPALWGDTPPGLVEGEQFHLRRLQEYGANWKFGVRGQF